MSYGDFAKIKIKGQKPLRLTMTQWEKLGKPTDDSIVFVRPGKQPLGFEHRRHMIETKMLIRSLYRNKLKLSYRNNKGYVQLEDEQAAMDYLQKRWNKLAL